MAFKRKLGKNKELIYADERLLHVAFIMDGNGRWAKKRSLPRQVGHKFGAEAFENTVENCFSLGIKHVTVYAFSTENWSRPEAEVNAIMKLLDDYMDRARKRENVRYIFIGDKSVLTDYLREKMTKLEDDTKNCERVLNIAFNYGARAEITRAFNLLIEQGKTSVGEEDISSALYTCASPDPDLIIRTANEYRLSNFLLWQCAYSELYITDVLWPDFNMDELQKALESFYKRKRSFGGLNKEDTK